MEARAKALLLNRERVDDLIQVDTGIILVILIVCAWLFYKILLKEMSLDRHRMVRENFKNILGHLFLNSLFVMIYMGLQQSDHHSPVFFRMIPLVGLVVIGTGAIVFIKTARLSVFQFLFFNNMRVGVPVLLINIFSLLLSMVIFVWLAARIFEIELTSIIATSAAFSVILGLAMQETLGNLFAGMAMQFDKPYEIGDWIEIHTGSQKWVGQVNEITWRATTLFGWLDETITVPNRVMTQSQISNFSSGRRPIVRLQSFRFPYGTDLTRAKESILESVSDVHSVLKQPRPAVIVAESTESWVTLRVSYFIADYGQQYMIGDEVIFKILNGLKHYEVELAAPRLEVSVSTTSKAA